MRMPGSKSGRHRRPKLLERRDSHLLTSEADRQSRLRPGIIKIAGEGERDGMEDRGDRQDRQAPRDDPDPVTRPCDLRVDETVGVAVFAMEVVVAGLGGAEREAEVTVRPVVMVLVGPHAVPVCERAVHALHRNGRVQPPCNARGARCARGGKALRLR